MPQQIRRPRCVLLYKAPAFVIAAVVVTASVKVTAGINIAGVVDMKRHGTSVARHVGNRNNRESG